MSRGTIFSIEDFAINDGPGIRTTVFLKGCPLRCAWCHNPEGQEFQPQYLQKRDGPELCGYEISSEELSQKLLRDKAIFKANGGGVTFTGGEPLAQPEFLNDTLKATKEIHRAIETSGYAPREVFDKILENIDLVLFDIKHTDSESHMKYTGVDNSAILGNLSALKESQKSFVVRIPLIPGVNDSVENMKKIADILRGAKNLSRIEILRYHKTAGAKYSMLGREYAPPFDTNAAPQVQNCSLLSEEFNVIIL